MQRLTERTPAGDVAYIGQHTQLPGLEGASTMRVAARRDVLDRLAAYEDTGLSPAEITALLPKVRSIADMQRGRPA
jgi:hypothetical protein